MDLYKIATTILREAFINDHQLSEKEAPFYYLVGVLDTLDEIYKVQRQNG